MKRLMIFAIVMMGAAGSAWGQKAVNKADILTDPEWKKVYDAYVPDAALIENLKAKAPQLKADVYFAYWCEDSKKHVPVFLKILDAIAVPEFKVNFYEVERKATPDQKYFVEAAEVEKVPTFIFFVSDWEMGRIVENPRNTLLQDMMIMVF